jgi:hypothetical protein
MNRNKLKTYAPQARRDFIQAVTDRATHYGLTATKVEPVTEQGEVVLIGGRPFPKAVAAKRKKLEARIKKLGFEQTMEAMAYTWFNRLVAIRFMELHGYLEHGFRVLSHPQGHTQPEILEHAQHVDLAGLDQKKVVELKLDGTKEEELYRLLLIAQCNALHKALPFLFESIDDETELLLPDHLLHSDSLIRNLVNEIEEEDWKEVEIIGWLYQFYISEKKDEVIGKVVASEDIPAATQLFTPNWIVKYLVQNTLGRQWLATYPNSPLKGQMEYYIEPAEQTPEVLEQLKAITPTSLNPEELTLLDPACGSGHILVEAYGLFKAIYQERGYRAKDIPALILQKNLCGLEIDDRAAQLSAFALMMKARADYPRIFESDARPNILAFEDSQGMNAADITHSLNAPINKEDVPKEYLFEEIQDEKDGLFSQKAMAEKGHVSQADIASLLVLFENAKTFGSLIQVPPQLAAKLPEIEQRLNDVLKHGDLTHKPARVIKPLLQQAQMLARQYDAVVANPPYMGSKFYNMPLKEYITKEHSDAKSDLCTAFIERGVAFTSDTGYLGEITMQSWMFLSTFATFRANILNDLTIHCMAHLGPHAFPQIGGQVVQVTAFVLNPKAIPDYRGCFKKLTEGQSQDKQDQFRTARSYNPSSADFTKIPGSPIAYWTPAIILDAFASGKFLSSLATATNGIQTGDNGRFVRAWHEVDSELVGQRWFPYAKGGTFRKWYGNCEYYVEWEANGRNIKDQSNCCVRGEEFYFRKGVTWSDVTSGALSCRILPKGFLFDAAGPSAFCKSDDDGLRVLSFMNSAVGNYLAGLLNPTLHFQAGNFRQLPLAATISPAISIARTAVEISERDWNSLEESWDFQTFLVLQHKAATLQQCLKMADSECLARFIQMKELEEENNRLFIEAYGLQDELSSEVPDDQITLYRPDREEDIKRLLSYAIGCMMGRYSLDKPGLIYAHSGNQEFDASQYRTFQADEDGILPLTEFNWFPDDAASRFEKFIATAWPADHLDDNLEFVAESLGPKKGESPRETIRRYLAADFYKHHLSMYKKRPIYWLFSSGKQRGFQALVYLHRYNEGTLARMRTEYVIPLLGKMAARIDHLTDDIPSTSSSQHRKRLETEKATIIKQRAEVQAFDERLRHCADQRIKLDLDDGVKVNYGKFGDLLAELKAVCGTKDEE